MAKKISAIVFLVISVLGIFILLTYGGPILPHIIGPGTAMLIGLILLLYKKKEK